MNKYEIINYIIKKRSHRKTRKFFGKPKKLIFTHDGCMIDGTNDTTIKLNKKGETSIEVHYTYLDMKDRDYKYSEIKHTKINPKLLKDIANIMRKQHRYDIDYFVFDASAWNLLLFNTIGIPFYYSGEDYGEEIPELKPLLFKLYDETDGLLELSYDDFEKNCMNEKTYLKKIQ